MPRFSVLIAVLCLLFSSGCSYFRLPVLQGNIVDYEKAEKLRLGMTPSQVEFLLGTPLIQDSFGAPRWDYVVYYRSPDADVLQKGISIYFEDDQVSRIEGREELLANWRKQKKLIDKVKKEKELLETPHPGQFPAEAGRSPATSGEEPHPVIPPSDPETREEILQEEPQDTKPDEDESAPAAPESGQSEAPPEATTDESSRQAQAESTSQDDAQRYPPDMSTIYQQR